MLILKPGLTEGQMGERQLLEIVKNKNKLILPHLCYVTEKVTFVIYFTFSATTQAMGVTAIGGRQGKWSLQMTLYALYLVVWNCFLYCE